ncbi:hypothetical protein DEA8626_00802 [Defluviimonas aquaemixtae]|uniref:Uncharacterized protein n=1 Tax=Albidovulum aquaemixtae TaxID=1542388 RepID=A0A2R8B3X1_9RHOB|nr:hypothetical protein [Defluviimonas aquaemixtae]SPH17285.1 hypothetical protein DEA8626_00802 [Defluviimonas aquaemixtae]
MESEDTAEPVVARVTPSPVRRGFALITLGFLGVLLELLAFLRPPQAFHLQLFLIVLGVAVLVLTARLFRATGKGLVLTESALRDTAGQVVAPVDAIRKVERGMLAFKPSNGFLLRLKEKQPRAWEPGLWWRFGRSVGVGGVISGAEGRAMADAIGVILARRGSA